MEPPSKLVRPGLSAELSPYLTVPWGQAQGQQLPLKLAFQRQSAADTDCVSGEGE